MRAATRQEQRAAAAEARQWQLDWRQRLVCLIAYAHAGFDAEPAARFLAIDGEGRGWRGKPEEERCRLVEDLFLEVDLEELGRLCDTDVIADARAMHVAVRYVEEWRLVCWARCRSESPVGAPPSTTAVLRQAETNRLLLPVAIRPPSLGLVCDTRARLWAYRWRVRWEGRFGDPPVRPPFSAEDGRAKVFSSSRLVWNSCWDPRFHVG